MSDITVLTTMYVLFNVGIIYSWCFTFQVMVCDPRKFTCSFSIHFMHIYHLLAYINTCSVCLNFYEFYLVRIYEHNSESSLGRLSSYINEINMSFISQLCTQLKTSGLDRELEFLWNLKYR